MGWSFIPLILFLALSIGGGMLSSILNIYNDLVTVLISQSFPILIALAILPSILLRLKGVDLKEIGLRKVKNNIFNVVAIMAVSLFVCVLFIKGNLLDYNVVVVHFLFVAIAEEVLARGIFMYELDKVFKPIVSLLISSLLFALVFHSNASLFLNLTVRLPLGIILASSYRVSGSLTLPIVIHWIYNVLCSI